MLIKRLFSLVILVVAVILIINVVVDNIEKENLEEQLTFANRDNNNGENENITTKRSNEENKVKDKVGLLGGMIAPDFTLPLWETKEETSLSDYRGKIVVLNLWASWCPPCQREMPDLIRFYEDYKNEGVHVLGVNLATLEKNENGPNEFMEKYQVTFPNFVDQPIDATNQRGIVATLYKVNSIPTTYVLDTEGKVFKVFRGEVIYEMLEDAVGNLIEK